MSTFTHTKTGCQISLLHTLYTYPRTHSFTHIHMHTHTHTRTYVCTYVKVSIVAKIEMMNAKKYKLDISGNDNGY